jgi:hypothetical protein
VVPVVGNVPLQPPEAAQELALEALHCRVTGAPTATMVSLALRLTNGGATTAGVVALPVPALPVGAVLGAVLVASVLLPDVSAFELAPHAASEPSAAKTNIDFNANADPNWRLRRIELIRVSQDLLRQLFPRSSIPFIRNL